MVIDSPAEINNNCCVYSEDLLMETGQMKTTYDIDIRHQTAGEQFYVIQAVYCKLFADSISSQVCQLRKQELNGRGGFTCRGCSMEK